MLNRSLKVTLITFGTALSVITPTVAEAIVFRFNWTGQIAGFRVVGSFGYDQTQSYPGGIVNTSDLDFLNVSFFDPSGNLLRTYQNNHLDSWANFNFDTQTRQILQAGSFNAPDGINIGAPNYDQQTCFPSGVPSGDRFCGNDLSQASGLTFWSKPPRSMTPHLHIDDWSNEFGFPPAFSTHEEIAFPSRTTQELIDTGRVGTSYLPPNGSTVTDLTERGQFAQVALVPEPMTGMGLLGIGSFLLISAVKRQKNNF